MTTSTPRAVLLTLASLVGGACSDQVASPPVGEGGAGGAGPVGPHCESQPRDRRAVQIATVYRGAFALLSDGTLWCWSEGLPSCPSQDPGKLPGLPCIKSFAASEDHAVAVDEQGGVWVWGERTDGVIVSFPDAQATWADAQDMTVAWGNRERGTWWGDDNFIDPPPLDPTPIPLEPVGRIILGAGHGCQLLDGDLRCFGFNADGELGNGETTEPFVPQWPPVPLDVDLDVEDAVAQAGSRSYARDVEGALWAWGRPWGGGAHEPSGPVPQKFRDVPPADVFGHSGVAGCVVTSVAQVWCWGGNASGSLVWNGGIGWIEPLRLPDLEPAAEVSIHWSGILCARKLDGTVWCRGLAGRPSAHLPVDGSATIAEFREDR